MPDPNTMVLWTLVDPAYWIQCLSAAVFAYAVLGVQRGRPFRWLEALWKTAFLVASFVAIHVILSLLAFYFRFFAGIGTWLAYVGGVALFSLLFSKLEHNAKLITTVAVFSAIITVFELGGVMGRFLELTFPGFDSLYAKAACAFLLAAEGAVLCRFRIARYYISVHAVRLNVTACFVSALCVIVFDLFSVHVFERGGDAGLSALMAVILFALCLINTLCYLMSYALSREHTNVLSLTAENQMNKSAASLMAVTEENLAELHKIRHDIANQYAYMRALLDRGDYDGLRSYFDELTGTFSEPLVPMTDCGNYTLNLIFNMLGAKARRQGVTLDITAAPPHELPFSELDLVKLYTNIIDNAIEACVSEEIPDPVVTVTVNLAGEYLFTRVTNPTKKENSYLLSGLPTTKGAPRGHGLGTGIVKSIIKKNNGSISYSIEDGRFIAEFLLCLKEAAHE